MTAGNRGETGATNATFHIITQKVTFFMQSILKHIDYCIDTIWNSSTAFSWLRKDNVCERHKTNCDVVLPLLLQN